jgi:hypothetical protein
MERALTLAGQAATTAASWWSTVTNILASVSQIDLALATLLAGVVCDFELSRALLLARADAIRSIAQEKQAVLAHARAQEILESQYALQL